MSSGDVVSCLLVVSRGAIDGTPGGGSVQLDPPVDVNLTEAGGTSLTLTSASSAVSLPIPSTGSALWCVIKVRGEVADPANAPRAIITSADGAAQVIPFDTVLVIGSRHGPTMTAIAVKGVCSIEYLIGG